MLVAGNATMVNMILLVRTTTRLLPHNVLASDAQHSILHHSGRR